MDTNSNNIPHIEIVRHSLAHILASAIINLYKDAKLGIGPATNTGFYYEVETSHKITKKDLPKIEEEMRNIIKKALPFKQITIPKEQAFITLLQSGQTYKSELLQNIPDEQITFYKTDNFMDLCRGPHIENTSKVVPFKLINVSSSHWMGDKSRPKLQKIEGAAFKTETELDDFLKTRYELLLIDYKKIATDMKLLGFNSELGDNLITWLHNGCVIKDIISNFILDKLNDKGFTKIQTPNISKFIKTKKDKLNNIILKFDDIEYTLNTSTLYEHIKVFKDSKKSYKKLPIRYLEHAKKYHTNKEYSSVYLEECIESNIFLNEENIITEINNLIDIIEDIYTKLEIKNASLEVRVPKNDNDNNKALSMLQKALSESKRIAKISTSKHYSKGVSLVFLVKDIHNTLQELSVMKINLVDAIQFDATYIDSNNQSIYPIIIEFSIINTFHILFKMLLEANLGEFPVWLSPIQVAVLPISEKFNEEASKVFKSLKDQGFRVDLNTNDEPMQSKIRLAEKKHIPYMLIIGEKEINTNSVSIRQRNGQELGLVRIEEFIEKLNEESK